MPEVKEAFILNLIALHEQTAEFLRTLLIPKPNADVEYEKRIANNIAYLTRPKKQRKT